MSHVKCGTRKGYLAHLSNGETPCDPCREANNEYQRLYRIRRRATRGSLVSYPTIAALVAHIPADLRDQLRGEIGAEVFDTIITECAVPA